MFTALLDNPLTDGDYLTVLLCDRYEFKRASVLSIAFLPTNQRFCSFDCARIEADFRLEE